MKGLIEKVKALEVRYNQDELISRAKVLSLLTAHQAEMEGREEMASNLSIIAARAFDEVERGTVNGEYECAIKVCGLAILHLEIMAGLAVRKPEESAEDFIKRTYGLWT